MIDSHILDQIKSVVGPKGWLAGDNPDISPWLLDSRGNASGRCSLFVQPVSTNEVSQVLSLCTKHRVAVVPQGGNTGRVEGATPDADGNSIILNLRRMNTVREVDIANNTITVDAGCILQSVQQSAEDVGRLFPLRLGAQGSCQIGGNLATNAGGLNVLHYGNTRDLTLGLEVVLPNGEVLSELSGLRKNNTGYDVKQLFIGAEGTLGVITAATLKLFPQPKDTATAFCALSSLDHCLDFLELMQNSCDNRIVAFELIPQIAIEFVQKHMDDNTLESEQVNEWNVLVEATGTDIQTPFQRALESGFEQAIIEDAVISQSGQQRDALWRIREFVVTAKQKEGTGINHDVAVPISKVPTFIRQANEAVLAICPTARPYSFGHVGDGNIHYDFVRPVDMDDTTFGEHSEPVHKAVFDVIASLDGSISAEHGIGRKKRDVLPYYRSGVALQLMRQIKTVLDPGNIMNPGKLL